MVQIHKSSLDLIETDVDDETIIVSLDSGQLYAVKDTGRAIWKLIDGKRDRTAILAELEAAYGEEASAIEIGVDKFIAEITAAGLIAVGLQAIAKKL
ncbi:MAG: PqqD family protein [Pontixanthobacter sp.]